tara:strand:- start:40700 stop:41650 length:951 start_codon:yes stop_codon:yes gene_type:complete
VKDKCQAIGDNRVSRSNQVIELVGNTPLLELSRIAEEVAPVRIFAKAEWFNPGGSVKDRPALNMILEAKKNGQLTPDKVILDATSGNTGIAYAMIGAALGLKVTLAVPGNLGDLHRKILKGYGAELAFSSPTEGSDGAIRLARKMAKERPDLYYYVDQYNNPANWMAHYNGTGLEILEQTEGAVTHYVAGLGTSGSFVGTGRRLKNEKKDVRLISFQPDSPMHGLEGLKHYPTSIIPGIYDEELADEEIAVETEVGQEMALRLAREEGILAGTSGGAAVACALRVARGLSSGLVVTLIPDGASKYLRHAFWENPEP